MIPQIPPFHTYTRSRTTHIFHQKPLNMKNMTYLCLNLAGCLFTISLIAQTPEEQIDSLATTTIQFEEDSYDFGTQRTGKVYSHVYRFKNTGNAPLVISHAKGSCGCTVPWYPKEPVMPGDESEIEVAFDSKGKYGPLSKRITITANTVLPQTFLIIRGTVHEGPFPDDPEPDLQETTAHDQMLQKIEVVHPNCFALFPNPASDQLQLELKEHIGRSADVMILNELGQPVHQSRIDHISRDATRFDISSYPSGIYMVTIRIQDVPPMTQCFVIVR